MEMTYCAITILSVVGIGATIVLFYLGYEWLKRNCTKQSMQTMGVVAMVFTLASAWGGAFSGLHPVPCHGNDPVSQAVNETFEEQPSKSLVAKLLPCNCDD